MEYTTRLLSPPTGFDEIYNRRSGLILLDGPRGPLLARYPMTERPPTARHRFITTYPDTYTVFDGARVPTSAPADVYAVAFPVEESRDRRTGISPGTVSPGSAPTDRDIVFSADEDAPLKDRTGLRVGPSGVQAWGGNGGVSVDASGVRVSGSFDQPTTQSKGVTRESPIFGLVPKSMVTFFAADYLPDLSYLKQVAQTIRRARQVIGTIRNVQRLL